jgi:hypothetical protein
MDRCGLCTHRCGSGSTPVPASTLGRVILLAIFPVLALVVPATALHAGVFDATWEPPVVVDTGAIDLSSSSGSAMEHTPSTYGSPWSSRDEWHVLYTKAGDIWHAVLTETGWLAPEMLSSSGGSAHDPKLAFAGDRMIVVWEDARRGHSEVWSRLWNGTTWTAEACLTDDAIPSRAPAIAASYSVAYLAWTEGTDGQTQIYGRAWNGYGWQTSANISASPAYAIEPSVTISPYGYEFEIVWADARHGETEIYLRPWMDGFGTATRLTNLTGSCRRPSAHAEECCGDVIAMQTLIAFENDGTGHNEAWTVCYGYVAGGPAAMISTSDSRASERPMAHGFPFSVGGEFGGVTPRFLITWTDAGAPGAKEHPLGGSWGCPGLAETEILSTQGLGTSAIAASAYDQPTAAHAGLLAAWLEERNGQRSLVIQHGSAPSCQDYTYNAPLAIRVSPAGTPGNTVSVWNRCGDGSPADGLELVLSFDWVLDGHLTWDAQQIHPAFRPQVTGPDGATNFAIRGGGCWNGGNASLRVDGIEVRHWYGVKSPDVDGDCAVLADDVAYVQLHLGTTDYCADLDGSGTVTQADVAIVQAALGQLCSQLAGAETDLPMPAAMRLNVRPNPSQGEVVFGLAGVVDGPAGVEIFDAAGRLVRAWDDAASLARGSGLTWDGRDEAAREVPSGVYFIRVRAGDTDVSRAFLITR